MPENGGAEEVNDKQLEIARSGKTTRQYTSNNHYQTKASQADRKVTGSGTVVMVMLRSPDSNVDRQPPRHGYR